MKKLFFSLFFFGFVCSNNVVVDAEGVPHVDSEASNPANKPSTLDDKSKESSSSKVKNKDGIENDTLKSKNAEVLK